MKKRSNARLRYTFILLLGMWLAFATVSYAEGLSGLAERAAGTISDFFKDKYNIKTTIIKFENAAGVSDLVAQRFYQLLVSRLEAAGDFTFTDLMINFHQNKGEFNLNRVHSFNHLIYLKLIRNKNKIGAGISIFSETLDKIVMIKYLEELYITQEKEIFSTTNFGFEGTGFSKIMEMEAFDDLLDCKSFLDQKGRLRFLFFYPEKIELFKLTGNQPEKILSYPLPWAPPYYPVLIKEGKLCVFFNDDQFYASVGANFSRYSKVILFKEDEGEVTEVDTVDFVPIRRVLLNNIDYLAGTRYALGKNYFQGEIILLPFQFSGGQLIKDKYLVKEISPFYSLDFSVTPPDNLLNSFHLVDRDYKYRFLADNFQELTQEEGERGSACCALGEQWLAVSDFSGGSDRLYFYAIEKGSRRLVFQNKVNGEILFISDGLWKAAPGFWVYVAQSRANSTAPEYKLQFWSKKSE